MISFANVDELKKWLDSDEKITLVDCREQSEWDEDHIEQAEFIPLSNFQSLYADKLKDKDAKIVIQCRSGKRSLQACQMLMQEGYSNLFNLEGGILAWKENNYPTI